MDEAPIQFWVKGPLPGGVDQVLSRLRVTEGVSRVAVMPDVHLASEFCVGTVVASEGMLFPNAVGGDIGCGMLAMRFDGDVEPLADPQLAARLLGELTEACPGRRHHRRTAPAMPLELGEMAMSDSQLQGQFLSEDLRMQLGTLGAGNHFLELQREEGTDALWLMIHTGSRHLGQVVLHHHLPRARRLAGGIMAIEAETDAGRAYADDVAVARAWAGENRRVLSERAAGAVERVLGCTAEVSTRYDCDHNHLEREVHEGRAVWVHRKGATAAGEGVRGIVPGSMGTWSFHTVGKGCAAALNSSSHGAGRQMSRTEARQKLTRSALRQQMRGVWYDARIEGQLLEEAPGAYKDVEAVMEAQGELTRVVRRLRPLLVYKGA